MSITRKKICILPRKLGLGGPASFQSSLIQTLDQKEIGVVHDPLDPTVSAILIIGGTPRMGEVVRAQRTGVRVVQRLNGMNWVHRKKYTGFRHFLKSEYGNMRLAWIRSKADRIVYQSDFSRNWWERVYGKLAVPQTVIYNGVDLDRFSPINANLPTDLYRILLVEGHLGGGYEQGLITGIQMVHLLNQRMEKRVELMVVGDVPEKLRIQAESMGEKITWRGVVKHELIPEIDRSAHLLFSADINAACPNAVIEALACGLPVIAFDTGAMKELVTSDCGRIASYGGDVWKLEPPDVYALSDSAREAIIERIQLSIGARQRAKQNFDLDQIVDRYIEVLLGD
jgi:glycosyltransferase involved in cell wall biosynthesis